MQGGEIRMDGGLGKVIIPGAYICEGQCAGVCHPQGDIQIPQTDIAVDAQNLLPGGGQSRGQAGTQGGFSGAALAGKNRDQFAHEVTSPA